MWEGGGWGGGANERDLLPTISPEIYAPRREGEERSREG